MTSFGDFCRINGLLLPGLPIEDGRIHRVPTTAHPRRKNGWYTLSPFGGRCQAFDMDPYAHTWKPEGGEDSVSPEEVARWKHLATLEREKAAKARERAARNAQALIGEAELLYGFPYLVRKGFPQHVALVHKPRKLLLVPMRDAASYKNVLSVQMIDKEGNKKFLPGGQARNACYIMGAGEDVILCEGYATGLSIQAALKALYKQARVAVCFSAGNIANVATKLEGRKFIMADSDASGTGARAAEGTGLPWTMPPVVGQDFNDLAQDSACNRKAVALLCDLLQRKAHA